MLASFLTLGSWISQVGWAGDRPILVDLHAVVFNIGAYELRMKLGLITDSSRYLLRSFKVLPQYLVLLNSNLK
jgi:hypothetical protein